MELIYAWIKKYKNIIDQEFNFSPNYHFKLDRTNEGLPKKDYVLIDFFSTAEQPNNFFGENISNVTAIIGKNGSGKSSLLSYIMNPKASGLLVFFDGENFYTVSETDLTIKSKNKTFFCSKSNILKNELSLIYFDNIFDSKNKKINENNLKSIKNISLSNLFFNKSSGNQSIFINNQIMKSLNTLSYLRKIKNNGKIKIRIPEELYIKNIDFDFNFFEKTLQGSNEYVKDLIVEIVFIENFPWYISELLENVETFDKLEKIIKEREEELIYLIYEAEKIKRPITLKEEEISLLEFQLGIETDQEELEYIESGIELYLDEIRYYKEEYQEELKYLEDYKIEMRSIKKAYEYLTYNPMKEFVSFLNKKSHNEDQNLVNMISLKYLEIFLKNNSNNSSNLYNFFEELGGWEFFPSYYNKNINKGLRKVILKYIALTKPDQNDILNLSEIYLNKINLITNFIDKHKINIHSNGLKVPLNNKNINEIKTILKEIDDNQHNELVLDFNWGDLSSGEISLFNILGRFYDLNQEIFTNPQKENILIILDEPEFSFHPEWQRKFLDIFYNYIESLTKDYKKQIQIILTSHSPFIAGDLPRNNIIMLNSKIIEETEETVNKTFCQVVNKHKKNTFGANIFDLYRDAFFIESTFGEFSKNKIKKVIKLLTPIKGVYNTVEIEQNINEIKYIINSIGEKIIKDRLEKAWKEYFISKKEDNYKKIERLMGEYNLKTEDLKKYLENNGDLL